MFNFSNNKDRRKSPVIDELKGNVIFQEHFNYWTFRPKEKDELMKKYPHQLCEKEKLKLLHQICLEVFSSKKLNPLKIKDLDAELDLDDEHKLVASSIVENFLKHDAVYRPRFCALWNKNPKKTGKEDPDISGWLKNMSLTHLGCLEVIRVNMENKPIGGVDFIPFDEIKEIMFAPPSLFRLAKIFYEGEREADVVYLPTIYGLSWYLKNPKCQNGSMTMFYGNLKIQDGSNHSIGLGQQDLLVDDKQNQSIMGINSIAHLVTVVETDDPKFEEKCRGRGYDPDMVRGAQKDN